MCCLHPGWFTAIRSFCEEPERFDPRAVHPGAREGQPPRCVVAVRRRAARVHGQHFSMLESVIALGVLVRDPVALPDLMYQQPGPLTIFPRAMT